jgi:hypothetical protein
MLDLIIRGGQVVTPWGVGDWEVAVQADQWGLSSRAPVQVTQFDTVYRDELFLGSYGGHF